MDNTTPELNTKSWLAFAAILLGFILTGIGGLLILSWLPRTASADPVVTALPATSVATPTAEKPEQDKGPNPAAATPTLTPTSLLTRAKSTLAAPEEPTPLPAGGTFRLTVLHTNDTWGYLDPCG